VESYETVIHITSNNTEYKYNSICFCSTHA